MDNVENVTKKNVVEFIIFLVFLMNLIAFSVVSLLDQDRTVSEKENRTLAEMPKLTVSSVVSGKFMKNFENYYSDTFPFRDEFLEINSQIKKYMTQFAKSDDSIIIIDTSKNEDDFAGESLKDVK